MYELHVRQTLTSYLQLCSKATTVVNSRATKTPSLLKKVLKYTRSPTSRVLPVRRVYVRIVCETDTDFVHQLLDFIFGQKATAWFDNCDIRVLAASTGYITANGRDSSSNPSYYVINKSTVSAASGNSVPSGAYYLGRPWRNYSRVVFQSTSMSNVINAAGWSKYICTKCM
jgi:hypothetical protein